MSSVTTAPIPEISIVLPVYRNADTLYALYHRLRHVMEAQRYSYEMVFVDDACPAGSLAILEELARHDPRVVVLALERNVGQNRAVLTGLEYTQGQWVVVMDADLQDSPEAIPDLVVKIREGYDAVFAGRRGRYESSFRLLTSCLFKRLISLLVRIPVDAGLFVAMSRRAVERLRTVEAGPFVSVVSMIGLTGLPLTSIPVLRARRTSERSAYSSWKRLKIGCLSLSWVLARKWRFSRLIRK